MNDCIYKLIICCLYFVCWKGGNWPGNTIFIFHAIYIKCVLDYWFDFRRELSSFFFLERCEPKCFFNDANRVLLFASLKGQSTCALKNRFFFLGRFAIVTIEMKNHSAGHFSCLYYDRFGIHTGQLNEKCSYNFFRHIRNSPKLNATNLNEIFIRISVFLPCFFCQWSVFVCALTS